MTAVDPRLETIRLLTSIDVGIKALLALSQQKRQAEAPSEFVDLDGPYGDPTIKAKDPKDWSGPPMTGKRFSECPAAYLDLMATRYDYFASKEPDLQKARYNRLDAARARGWAAKIRAGYQAPVAEPVAHEPTW